MKLGDLTITLVNGGNFRLDGGAMHGVVPKTIWSRLTSCDEHNRCQYSTNCLLVEDRHGKRTLIETGNGEKFSPKERDIYGIDHDHNVETQLRALGVEPESIDLVIMSHLHFDHSGGTTRRRGDTVEPVFSRARHVVQKQEWHDATHPHERNRASYLPENFAPLEAAGLLQLVDGETEVAPGIRVVPTPGHTRGHQSVLLGASDEKSADKLLFLGDVVPTAVHVRLPFIMAYDLDVVGTLESKRRVLTKALEDRWLVAFGHDLTIAAGRLGLDAKGQLTVAEPVAL